MPVVPATQEDQMSPGFWTNLGNIDPKQINKTLFIF
jgi:hypothetical protein